MNQLVIATIVYFVIVFIGFMLRGRKFLTLPYWLKGAIVAPLLAGMFYTVWWMQNDARKKEITFMGVCWIDGSARLPVGGIGDSTGCSAPEQINWRNKSLTVYWAMSEEFNVYKESHTEAMEWWNKQLGWEVFTAIDSSEKADVIIVSGSVNVGRGAMSTSFTRDVQSGIKATITVKVPGNIREWMLEEEHELAHVLGLAHDRQSNLITNPSLDESSGMRIWFVSEKDKKALIFLYKNITTDESISYD